MTLIRIRSLASLVVCAVFLMISNAYALEPPTKEQIRQYQADGTWKARLANAFSFGNHKMDPELVQRAEYKIKDLKYKSEGKTSAEIDSLLVPPPVWRGMPTTGNVKMFILLIEFNDYPHITPADDLANVDSSIFGAENTASVNYPYESLTAYYKRSSYGLLNLQGATLGWYNPGVNRSAIPETDQGRETLIKQAITSFDSAGHDFSQYDNDGDGDIDYFAVIWTGPHGAWASFWWGYQTGFTDNAFTIDGKRLAKYSWQWESYSYPGVPFSPLVLIHETGHALGLPDYYDYSSGVGPEGGVGGLDMMDANWGDHNAFSKFVLDWLTPALFSSINSYPSEILRPSSKYPDAFLIMPDASGDGFSEYFFVQYRKKEKNDLLYPENGLLIWHVDATLDSSGIDYLYDNSYTDHKLLRLMEADGLEEIEQFAAWADAGDFYTTGDTFSFNTVPNSNAYTGNPTGIKVDTVSSPGTTISFDIDLLDFPTVSITSPENNAAVNGMVTISAQAAPGLSAPITHVEFFVDGVSIGVATASPYTKSWNTTGIHSGGYDLSAVATNDLGFSRTATVHVYIARSSVNALILDLGSDNKSGQKIGDALASQNIRPVFGNSIGTIDPSQYPAVFLCLGYWPGNHVLSSTESDFLTAYLNAGGNMYMEGGDTWAFDSDLPIHIYFGIAGLGDGVADLNTVTGISGSFTEGVVLTSTGTQQSYVDHLGVLAGASGATAIWENTLPIYCCGIANQTPQYKSIGTSFEFGNITDEAMAVTVMKKYLGFFQVSAKKPLIPMLQLLLLE